jgi:hypothetical protein
MPFAIKKHAWMLPFSAALRKHCIANRLLRVTPRPRAWQMMHATLCDVMELKK